jgi:hypothetical protein
VEIRLLDLAGFYSAAYGARLSYSSTSKMDTQPGCYLGEKDTILLKKLVLRGNDHAKALRMVTISFWIKATAKWFSQFDTYKVGVVRSSSSQMHMAMKEEITPETFEGGVPPSYIEHLERLRQRREFTELILALPQSYLYEGVISTNYQALRSMYFARMKHRWYEWEQFGVWIEGLPLASELICCEKDKS